MSLKCPLGKLQQATLDPDEKKAMQRQAWRQPPEDRTLHIAPEDFKRLTPIEYQVAVRIGDKLFGRVINGR